MLESINNTALVSYDVVRNYIQMYIIVRIWIELYMYMYMYI